MKKLEPISSKPQSTEMASTSDEVRVLSFNVGHGDCTLVEYWMAGALSFRCLVDGGKSLPDALLKHLRAHRHSNGSHDIDVLILSHVDADHQGGLPSLVADDIRIGEYLGPCLPTFRRLGWLFAKRVQTAIERASDFEHKLRARQVPVTYPLEGFTNRYVNGRVVLSVLSPAPRLLEKLSTANGAELSNLLMRQPMALQWLFEEESDDPRDDNQIFRELFRNRISLSPEDFSWDLPQPFGLDSNSLQDAASAAQKGFDPEFFGNAALNDTSLVVALDFHLDGIHRKRILLTGDQENWSYLASRHAGGLGVDVLKAPHHGGRVYLDDKREAIDSLYLWLRPRTVLVSANGQHDLPRLAFRDVLRTVGATLICPNVRSTEPLTAGFVRHFEEKSCFKALPCSSSNAHGITSVFLTAKGEYSDACACVQGIIHGGPAPIVVLRQDIISPSESIVRYTRGELENHTKWIRSELDCRHNDFVKHADTTEDKFATRVNQEAVSWKSISAAARAAGRHDLAVDPRPVLQFARSHFLFWAQPESHYCQDEWHLYRKPTRKEVQDTTQWLLKVPRILLYCENITQRQLATNAKLEILLSAKWDVVDGLLAGMLAAPLELVADDIRPSLLQAIADQFTARICSVSYPSRKFEEGEAYLLLEQQGLTLPFPNLENEYWKPAVQWDSGKFPSAPWKLFYEAASKELLVGKFPNQNAYGRENWPQSFNKNYSSDKSPFEQRFLGVEWTWLWGNL